jgi:hydroxymethylbilane synthase
VSEPLRLGTRASPLALIQARSVAAAIAAPVALVELRTSGDDGAPGDKRRWVDRIEEALLAGDLDLAVHSAKDLPGELAVGLEISGAPARADPFDAICGAPSLAALAAGARVGTGSVRRAAQLLALRDDLEVVAISGNVDTRLARIGELDGVVLARAGLARLGRDLGAVLEELVPAAGQGTLAIEARRGDARVADAIAGLRDPATERALAAERALIAALGGDCDTPIGAHAAADRDGALALAAFVGRADGSHWIRDQLRGEDPVALGAALAQRLLSAGAAEILR